jgi:hypothetical protein
MKNVQRIKRLRKGRCVVMLVLLMAITVLAGGLLKATAADEGRLMQSVVVKQGDTLWSLVEKNYDYRGDIRNAIYEVRRINNLQDTLIVPGQLLYIPQR